MSLWNFWNYNVRPRIPFYYSCPWILFSLVTKGYTMLTFFIHYSPTNAFHTQTSFLVWFGLILYWYLGSVWILFYVQQLLEIFWTWYIFLILEKLKMMNINQVLILLLVKIHLKTYMYVVAFGNLTFWVFRGT